MKQMLFAALLCAPQMCLAETIQLDAFGIFPSDQDSDRLNWAGVTHQLEDDQYVEGRTDPDQIEQLDLVFGQKTIEKGRSEAHMVVLLFDAHGNLVTEGVSFDLVAADGRQTVLSDRGIVERLVAADDAFGEQFAWASHAEGARVRQSERALYRVVPSLDGMDAVLDLPVENIGPEQVFNVGAQGADGSGHTAILDGIATLVLLRDVDETYSLIPGTWIGGTHQARVLTRDLYGSLDVVLHHPNLSSPSETLVVSEAEHVGPLQINAVTFDDIAATRLTVGPFVSSLGYQLLDGAAVSIKVEDATGAQEVAQAWILDGLIEVTIGSASAPFSLEVTSALGLQRFEDVVPEAAP